MALSGIELRYLVDTITEQVQGILYQQHLWNY
jgi:hypothetical protein